MRLSDLLAGLNCRLIRWKWKWMGMWMSNTHSWTI